MSTIVPVVERPQISVVLPLADTRGLGLKGAQSWVENHATDATSYEVVTALGESSRQHEGSLRAILRPHDQLIVAATNSESELFHIAAMRARGDVLFFTEGHCVADPGAIDAALAWFSEHVEAGFFAYTPSITHNELGTFEEQMFETAFRAWEEPDCWIRFHLRATAIRRSAYLETGGLEFQYGLFSAWLLAAKLHATGHQILPTRSSRVRHVNAETFDDYHHAVGGFGRGESRYRLDTLDRQFAREYFGWPPEWPVALFGSQGPCLEMFSAALALHRRLARQVRGVSRRSELLQSAVTAARVASRWVWGKYMLETALRLQLRTRTQLARWAPTHGQRFHHFRRYYDLEASLGRVHVAQHDPRLTQAPGAPCTHYPVTELDEPEVFGFHGREVLSGEEFRWSEPVAAVRLHLAAGGHRGVLQLNHVRPLTAGDLVTLHLGPERLPIESYDRKHQRVTFTVPPRLVPSDDDYWLVISCRPWQAPDTRALGLPIVAVTLTADSSSAHESTYRHRR